MKPAVEYTVMSVTAALFVAIGFLTGWVGTAGDAVEATITSTPIVRTTVHGDYLKANASWPLPNGITAVGEIEWKPEGEEVAVGDTVPIRIDHFSGRFINERESAMARVIGLAGAGFVVSGVVIGQINRLRRTRADSGV